MPRALRKTEEVLSLHGAEASLRLAVVADTHSRPHADTHRLLAALKPDAILHAGDIGALRVIDELEEVAPTIAVRGNIDGLEKPDDVVVTVEQEGTPVLRLLLTHIAVYGPKLRADAARRAKAADAAMVVCGHSHVPFIGRDRGLVIFNPGSVGPRRFSLPITFGVMEISKAALDLQHHSCETGARWSP
ncbi:MAG: metallophosphoesterase family protein [Polyangiaceae bacterium]